ncbi:peptidoglycan-binding protein [Leptolyngbya sp. FACHB-261]|uniref:peptidoglycan-binding domain-containing protein n=1 Tax=Leptolyngbya sp. FACHB-261 TaxID=2692806 RepID=UPI001681DB08|nr:peptidoglycan-binding domain-containing protein [Leptolyngbya sp. FACHB-261]MBD2104044.1 peptidoglycan-binding protein [Leptolyngbya sp. FACHB-261]
MAETTILTEGDQGATVTKLQNLLKKAGFDPGPIDGMFGPSVTKAAMRFQQAKRLPMDGVVGPRTWAELEAAPPPSPPPFSLINVCKFYNKQPHQDQALTWLQGQIPQATLDEFVKRWRGPASP